MKTENMSFFDFSNFTFSSSISRFEGQPYVIHCQLSSSDTAPGNVPNLSVVNHQLFID